MQVTADWFRVELVYESERTRVFIERVIMWALIKESGTVERIVGLGSQGMPCETDGDMYYVQGAELSPAGESWLSIYNSITPSKHGVRELEEPALLESFNDQPDAVDKSN